MEGIRLLTTATHSRLHVLRKGPLFLDAIRFHESIFALPFAYMGMILAADGFPGWQTFAWITVAMVSARTVGMAANRIIDRKIDALNPRASARHLPSGLIKVNEMTVLTAVAFAIFIFAASQLNTLSVVLAPVAAAYLVAYPFTKRFTWAANLLLGWALAMSPSAAWIGVNGSLSLQPVLLSLAVALWAGSFDIIYHTQDREFHLQEGLNSVAVRFGVVNAFRLARSLDVLAVASLIGLGLWMELAWPYFVGCAAASGLLSYKYRMVSPTDLSRLGIAFGRINAYTSTTMFVATILAMSV